MNRVFVSYSRKNETIAERIARDLDDAGLDVWFDRRQIHGGEIWEREIQRGLERAEFAVVCLSPSAITSEWVQREVLTMQSADKPVYPVIVEDYQATIALLRGDTQLGWLLDVQFINFIDRYQSGFQDLLKSIPGGRARSVFDDVSSDMVANPFKGLEAFQQRDASFFFGREDMIRRALRHLRANRFLAIVGASGSGKSSLVRAGIIPQIRQGSLFEDDASPIILFTPGATPIYHLAERLHPLLNQGKTEERTATEITAALNEPDQFVQFGEDIRVSTPDAHSLIVVVDQFEEVFTRATQTERNAFIRMIVTAANHPDSNIRMIVTMRADFFGNLSAFPELASLFEQDNLLIVTEMTAANLLRAIEGPVRAVGMTYEAGLVDRILEDVNEQPGSLPLLQYALRELFKRRDGLTLTNAAYDAIGGVRQALAQHAESIFDMQTPDDQQLIKRVLLKLVEVNENGEITRRRVARDEFVFKGVSDETVQDVIDQLTAPDARLLVASREIRSDAEQPTIWIEVSHEALIREWDRFKSWVTADLDELQYDSELRKAAADWIASGRETGYLLTGKRLTRAEVWLEQAEATANQREFIQASLQRQANEQAAERQRMERELQLERLSARRARLALGFFILLSLFLIAGGAFAVVTINQLNTTTTNLERTSDQLREQSVIARSLSVASSSIQALQSGDTDLALSLALQAGDVEPFDAPPQTEQTLSEVAFSPGTQQLISLPDIASALDITPDGDRVAVGLRNGTVQVIHIANLTDEPITFSAGFSVVDLAISPSGRYVLVIGRETLLLQDIIANTQQTFPYQTRRYTNVAFLDETRVLLGANDGIFLQVLVPVLANTQSLPDSVTSQRTEDQAITAITTSNGRFAYGTADGTITLFTGTDTQLVRVTDTPNSAVTALTYDADAELLFAAFSDGTLAKIEGTTIVAAIQQAESSVSGLAVVGVEPLVAVIANDGTLRLYDTITLRQIETLTVDDDLLTLVGQPDDRYLITGTRSGALRIWNVSDASELRRFSAMRGAQSAIITLSAISPDQQLIAAGSDNATVYIWDANTGEPVHQINLIGAQAIPANDVVSGLDFSPDGTRLVVSANSIGTTRSHVTVWDTTTFELVNTYDGHEGQSVTVVRFAPDSQQVASAGTGGVVHLWDVTTNETIHVLSGHEANRTITGIAFSADGTHMVTSAADQSIILWNVENGTIVQRFIGHNGTVRAADVDLERGLIASASTDTTVRVWDIERGREIQRFDGHTRTVYSVYFVPQTGDIVSASADGTIRLWDQATGLELRRYTMRDPNGREIRIFDMVLGAQSDVVLATLGDNSARLFRLIPERERLITWIRDNRFVRELNCNEKLLFNVLDDPLSGISGEQRFIEATDGNTVLRPDMPVDSGIISELPNGTAVRIMGLDDTTESAQICVTLNDIPTEGWVFLSDLSAPASETVLR